MIIDGMNGRDSKIGHDSNDGKKHENGFKHDSADGRPPGLMSVGQYGAQSVEEVWVQNKTNEGKIYYYNARTRESSWTKPEGLNTRVITQEEVEQMAAFNAKTQLKDDKTDKKLELGSSQDMKDLKVKNIENRESTITHDNQIDTNQSQSFAPGSGFFPPGMPPTGFGPPFMPPPGLASMMPPPGMFPPPTGFPGFPPFGPPFGMPFGGMMPSMQGFQKPKTIDEKMKELKGLYDEETLKQIRDAEEQMVKAREDCAIYTEHETPEGKKYYFNTKSNESTWDKPKCFNLIQEIDVKLEALKKKKLDKTTNKTDEKELSEEEKAKQRSKPVSSTPVPGTPWCVVWTRDGRVFFYNPSEHVSLWERPLMLLGRTDVDKMVNEPPKDVEITSSNKPISGNVSKTSNLNSNPSVVIKKKLSSETQLNANEVVNEEPPLKKNKTSEIFLPSSIQDTDTENSNDSRSSDQLSKKIEPSKESAVEAEAKAARERAQIPLEQRLNQFREMLAEREVSAFSTWEKELHKIVFDPRYLLLTSKERKQVFEKYIKERADEERKEKAVLLKRKRDLFRELLKEANVHAKTSFNDFTTRHLKDERFKQIEKMKERESLFNEYQSDLRKKEKEDKYVEKEKLKKDYLSMLKELRTLHYNSSWTETKRQIENDPRYRAVDSSSRREDWFRDYVRMLPELNSSANESANNSSTHLNEPESETDEDKEKRKEKEKQERIEASIKEREKEVKEQLSKYQSEREKERDQLKRDEAIECFKALLSDLVKTFDSNWKETKKSLKRDSRWDFCKSLSKEDKENLYDDHIKILKNKKKSHFYALLDQTSGVSLNSTWKEVKKLIKSDPRYEKLTQLSDLKLDKEFDNYINDKYQKAKNDFRQLLQETKLITYKSYSMIQESEQHLKDIEEILMKDKCYMVLECAPDERKKILLEYIEQLDREGPPPPPTATEPNRRK